MILITDASYRMDLCRAILQLQENGVISELQNKWWKQKRGGDTCDVWYLFSRCIMTKII